MRRIVSLVAIAIAVAVPSMLTAQVTNASLKGTYTWQVSTLDAYSPAFNWSGQQVGFCVNDNPFNYNCGYNVTFDLVTGTIVADGAGHVTGTFDQTADPNSYECESKNNPTDPCPVIVPSGKDWSATISYSVGNTVDFAIGKTTRTYQAVKANTDRPPNWGIPNNAYICNGNSNSATCIWVQVYASLTNPNGNSSGTVRGTYTVSGNGSGTMTLIPTGCDGCSSITFAIIVPPTDQVGQVVPLSAKSELGNENKAVGAAVRVK